jgi:hypothetical protein
LARSGSSVTSASDLGEPVMLDMLLSPGWLLAAQARKDQDWPPSGRLRENGRYV